MPTQQNVVYYDGVPYIDSRPTQGQSRFSGSGPFIGSNGVGMFAQNRFSNALSFDQLVSRGFLKPLQQQQPQAAPTVNRPPPAMTQMPQSGWAPPAAQGGAPTSLDAILNGEAPQFGATPQAGAPAGMPPAMPPAGVPGMPSPAKPQRNFDALGQNIMSQVLNGGGVR